ncbi:hypothetical protein ACHAXA_001626 [Cyclostephanos tholiformis]|uniref:Uncharacterized protein n=1 Tax=Cyclostephanos tholiformis TaxID=382380 RepID=A0ABD3RBN6_9STRA
MGGYYPPPPYTAVNTRGGGFRPGRFMAPIDVDAMDVTPDAEGMTDEMDMEGGGDGGGWTSDGGMRGGDGGRSTATIEERVYGTKEEQRRPPPREGEGETRRRSDAASKSPPPPSSSTRVADTVVRADYDESNFTGRRPGEPVNRARGGSTSTAVVDDGRRTREYDGSRNGRGRDPRERHVVLDDYDDIMDDPFAYGGGGTRRRPMPPPPRPGGGGGGGRRSGPSVYTQEEEDLIESMGGRRRGGMAPPPPTGVGGVGGGPRTTQEFAGLGTMSRERGRANRRRILRNGEPPVDPLARNYNPEQIYDPPSPSFPPPNGYRREEGYLGDSTLVEISLDYSVPIPYLADVLANWGVPVPIDLNCRLGDMVTGEQAFAILEAIHTLDVASLHGRYSEEDLVGICDIYDIEITDAFEFCIDRGWALPFGVRTFLRVEQEEELLDALG